MWHSDKVLGKIYPDLYLIVVDRDALVSSFLCSRGEDGTHDWNLRLFFIIFMIGRWLEGLDSLMELLYSYIHLRVVLIV